MDTGDIKLWRKMGRKFENIDDLTPGGTVLFRCITPPIPEHLIKDTPDEYVVKELPNSEKVDYGGVIVFGRYGDRWEANPSCRALVKILLDEIRILKDQLKAVGL